MGPMEARRPRPNNRMSHRAIRHAARSLTAARVFGHRTEVERDRNDPRRTPRIPDHHGPGCTRSGGIVGWRAERELLPRVTWK